MERATFDERRLIAAARVLGRHLRPGDVVLLEGPMGAGKTTFVRGLAEGLGITRPERVRSPTYTICVLHEGPRPLAHVDLFRLASDDAAPGSVHDAAFEALGLETLAEDPESSASVLVVEWADLWAQPPASRLCIRFDLDPERPELRRISADAVGERSGAVLAAWSAEIGVS